MAIGIGLDVGGTKVLAAALDEKGDLLGELRVPTPRTTDALFDALATCVETLRGQLGERAGELEGVGVGLPGLVDRAGVLHETANLHGMSEVDLPGGLRPRLDALRAGAGAPWRLVIDNDASCATVAEHAFGAGRGGEDSVFVTLGTGIGGGVVSGGRLVRGARNFGGEVGHMVVDPSGPRCGCGRSGCWERFCSGTGLAWLARRAAAAGRAPHLVAIAGGPEVIEGHQVVLAARDGDPGALAVVEEYGAYLAIGLGNIVEMLDPGCIVLGGGLTTAGDVLFAPGLERYRSTYRRGSGPRAVPVVFASLGERAGACGAAALSLGIAS